MRIGEQETDEKGAMRIRPDAMSRKPCEHRRGTAYAIGAALTAMLVAGCGSDDESPTPQPPPPAVNTPTAFKVRIDNVGKAYPFVKSGAFDTPVGAGAPAPIGPGGAYEFSFTAPKGAFLSFATMFVPSNDYFFAPAENGIALYDSAGTPASGDITSQVMLWDAGSEINQEPGFGPDQVQRQAAPNTGAPDPDPNVRLVADSFGNLPAVADVLRVTLTSTPPTGFTVRIENVSTAMTLATSDGMRQAVPLSPGAFVVHSAPRALFTIGAPDRGKGLAAIAEDGDPKVLTAASKADTGVTVPLSPGVWAIHTTPDPLFIAGQRDLGQGLSAIAEDGDPTMLAAALPAQAGIVSSGAFTMPVGMTAAGAIGPGGAFEFPVTAIPGQRLSLATMYVPSNDLFFAPQGQGIALHNVDGTPVSGDVTTALMLFDAGTEVNQEPGVGPDQVQRQSAPNTGAAESVPVAPVADGFMYETPASVIRVTVTPSPSQ